MCPDYMVAFMHYEWEEPAPGVHRCRLPFLDVTVGLVAGASRVLLIDCGTTPVEATAVADDVAELTGRAVTDLVLTHHHFDHILGSGGFPAARIHATEPVRRALTAGAAGTAEQAVSYGASCDEVAAAVAGLRAPDVIVDTRLQIDLGDRPVSVEHPGRGHTDHDLVVLVPGSPGTPAVVFCGDLVEESGEPATGPDCDADAWPSTLDRVLALGGPDAVYVPGHGAMVDAGFVRRQRDWLTSRCAAPDRACRRRSRPTPG